MMKAEMANETRRSRAQTATTGMGRDAFWGAGAGSCGCGVPTSDIM